ncbi:MULTISPECIES: dimethylamine monooxygenase subunit DmmA family protein [Oceanospirillaceae]|uniref:Dimethylamine monooxygenase subunit DmmA family protein n=1 Tax=Oceanobacter antarcticus TaxID=3133425 RepID=A0ABW8NIJ7_9GAMM|tara:strand:- start:4737 stop:5285 length:549 start_codon:yes stop_codon:yes gene_type:complete
MTLTESIEIDERIKSRPEYRPLTLLSGKQWQIFIAQNEDQTGLKQMHEECVAIARPGHIVLWVMVGDDLADSLKLLADAPVAAAVYVAGDEPFLWDIRNALLGMDFAPDQIQLMAPASHRRRLFCTHCYTLTEDVTHSPHRCSGCGELLLVRDHFSRLHGAYVGVSINAEDRSQTFQPEEVQ